MDIKTKLIENFEKKYIKKEQFAKVFEVNFRWEYLSLFEICSKPKILTFIKSKYKEEFKNETIFFSNKAIDSLRFFLKELDQAYWEYLSLTNDGDLIFNYYNDFLKTVYSQTKKFVNNFLIEMILCLNEQIKIQDKSNSYEVNEYFEITFLKFKNTFQKYLLKMLKLISKKYSNISIINLVIQTYEEQLNEQKNKELND